MDNENDDIKKYLARTGQSYQDLMSGAEAFGIQKILDLVKEANRENKKIIWQDGPESITDSMSFTLQQV